ncbi:MAG: methylcobamide--CoM methyltransferase [Chloroflexi bacterium]|nr:methylcobamide--CoM methyltransferase [Chloroflexota bacterium]
MIVTAVGNYPRTQLKSGGGSVRRALTQLDRGEITWEGVLAAQDAYTKEVIEEQVEAGLDVVTDGQVRWDDAQTYWASHLEGFAINGLIRWFDTNTYYRHPSADGKISWTRPISLRDYKFAIEASLRPVKVVLTGPYTLAKLSANKHYPDLRSFVLDLAAALNKEAKALEALKPYAIQFDEPAIVRPGNKGDLSLFQEAMQVLVQGLKSKTALCTYFGDIEGLAPEFFHLPFDVLGLDFWMGPKNWDLLTGFPQDKELGLGIVDARNTKLESVEWIVEQVRRAGKHVSYDRLHINPSCGLEFLPRDRARLKLFRMVEGVNRAREVLKAGQPAPFSRPSRRGAVSKARRA